MRLIPSLALAALPLATIGIVASPARAQEMSFQTPSGNIHCMIFGGDETEIRCDIIEFTPSYARPASCEQDYGHAFALGIQGSGWLICAGDTVRDPSSPVLPYGRSYAVGAISCLSEQAGLTCTNASGNGFFLSRATQRVN